VSWVADSHGTVELIADPADWDALLKRYEQVRPSPLASVFDVARANRCRTVVVENRYVDADFRSEYSAFWSLRFQDTPAFAQRLHFFSRTLSEDDLHNLPTKPGYLGYCVLRPTPVGRVGRTVLRQPRRVAQGNQTLVADQVNLFGNSLEILGVPYCEQDGEFLVCAHAAAWMCHYSAYRRGLVGRQLSATFAENSPDSLVPERAIPSKGLTLNQLQAIFGATGQPALFYGLTNMPTVLGVENPTPKFDSRGNELEAGYWDTRLFSIICRYLNSGFPVLVGSRNHAFVIVGWFKRGRRIYFVAADDQRGPYEVVKSPFSDVRAPWRSIMVPLPPKVFLSGENAENSAHYRFRAWGATPGAPAAWKELGVGIAKNEISLRTFLRSTAAYKQRLLDQGRSDSVVRLLRLARLPHWVWVVEAHDRDARAAGSPSVIAEAVFDSTSSDRRPRLDAISLPGFSVTLPPDDGKPTGIDGHTEKWRTQLVSNH
jgi:hypothetical protein